MKESSSRNLKGLVGGANKDKSCVIDSERRGRGGRRSTCAPTRQTHTNMYLENINELVV